MTSERQIAANRRNATRSTGPITVEGKARSSRNASRHGLSRPASCTPAIALEIGEFALQLVGEEASPTQGDLAHAAAAAHLELMRIRHERQRLVEVLISTARASGRQRANVVSPDAIGRLDRYERRAESRRKKWLRGLSQLGRLPIFR
jgi:hypothetical protein